MPYITRNAQNKINSVGLGKPQENYNLVIMSSEPITEQLAVGVNTLFIYKENDSWKFIYVHPNRDNAAGVIQDNVVITNLEKESSGTILKSILPQDPQFAPHLLPDGVSFIAEDDTELTQFRTDTARIIELHQLIKAKKQEIQDFLPEVTINPTPENQTALSDLVTEKQTLETELNTLTGVE